MLGWLVSQVMTAILGAFVVWKAIDIIFHGILGPAASAVKTGVFVGVGTAITTGLGIRSFTKAVRGLRDHTKEVGTPITLPPINKPPR